MVRAVSQSPALYTSLRAEAAYPVSTSGAVWATVPMNMFGGSQSGRAVVLLLNRASKAEVDDLHLIVFGYQDVLRFDVAVNVAPRIRMLQRGSDLFRVPAPAYRRECGW